VSNFEDQPRIVREEVPATTVRPADAVDAGPVIEAQALGARTVVEPQVVVQPAAARIAPTRVVGAPVVVAPAGAVRTTSVRRFAPDAIIAAAVGLVVLIIGLLAIVRGGFDGPMEDPVVEVLGFTHTTTLGLIEVVLGGLLLICGVSSWRSGALFFGSIMAIGGFIGAVQTESFARTLALESGLAWLVMLGGIAVVASALLIPRYVSRATDVRAY
jgi:hypothetical protein